MAEKKRNGAKNENGYNFMIFVFPVHRAFFFPKRGRFVSGIHATEGHMLKPTVLVVHGGGKLEQIASLGDNDSTFVKLHEDQYVLTELSGCLRR